MPQSNQLSVQDIEEKALSDFPEVVDALNLFEIAYEQYISAVQAQAPHVTYSASSTSGG